MIHAEINRIRLKVMKAAAIIISVATIDRGDNLDTPQTECPLVHPLDKVAPTPTKKPATIKTMGCVFMSNEGM